jgi:hypothetical protein
MTVQWAQTQMVLDKLGHMITSYKSHSCEIDYGGVHGNCGGKNIVRCDNSEF